nr:protein nuclear fusion defective 4-like [Tanacetum cinerariifolium]
RSLLIEEKQEVVKHEKQEVIFSEVEDEATSGTDSLPDDEREKKISHLQAKLMQAAAEM